MAGSSNTCRSCWNIENGVFVTVMGGILSFITLLILGSYGYTWGESKADTEEKTAWRSAHEALLEKKFEEVKQGQQKVEDALHKSTDDTRELLRQILDEQRRNYKQDTEARNYRRKEQ